MHLSQLWPIVLAIRWLSLCCSFCWVYNKRTPITFCSIYVAVEWCPVCENVRFVHIASYNNDNNSIRSCHSLFQTAPLAWYREWKIYSRNHCGRRHAADQMGGKHKIIIMIFMFSFISSSSNNNNHNINAFSFNPMFVMAHLFLWMLSITYYKLLYWVFRQLMVLLWLLVWLPLLTATAVAATMAGRPHRPLSQRWHSTTRPAQKRERERNRQNWEISREPKFSLELQQQPNAFPFVFICCCRACDTPSSVAANHGTFGDHVVVDLSTSSPLPSTDAFNYATNYNCGNYLAFDW